MVETKKVMLSMDIEIEIPKDIVSDRKRLKKSGGWNFKSHF